MSKYKDLTYKGKIYKEPSEIEDILVKEGFSWFLNSETYKAKLEIYDNTLIFNSGTWYNGIWEYGAWRGGEWKFGTWENGVWFNGLWQDGMFKNGIIFNGTFFQGQFINAKIRTTNQDGTSTRQDFIDCDLSPSIVKI